MTLSDAIAAVETSATNRQNGLNQLATDQGVASGLQTKLDAANATVATDQTNQAGLDTAYNSDIDNLIAAAQASKVPVSSPAPAPAPAPAAA